ncbi:MAG: hypothetical protein ABIO44_04120, partial [Saprospiraceae bacterium]
VFVNGLGYFDTLNLSETYGKDRSSTYYEYHGNDTIRHCCCKEGFDYFIASKLLNIEYSISLDVYLSVENLKKGWHADLLTIFNAEKFNNQTTYRAVDEIFTHPGNVPFLHVDKPKYSMYILNGKEFFNVYHSTEFRETFFNKEFGLIGFEDNNGGLWSFVKLL